MKPIALALASLAPFHVFSQTLMTGHPEDLYNLVVRGGKCEALAGGPHWRCEYAVGSKLRFVVASESSGRSNIAFRHSDINDDFYAVVYDGCIAVVPATAHPRNYEEDYVAYVAPADGRVYRELTSCKAAKPI